MRAKVNLLPDEIKFQVVQKYLSGVFTQKELMDQYNIGGKQCINNWMRKFGVSKPNKDQKEVHRAMANEKQKSSLEKELDLKVKKLEEDLKREQFKTKALNTMIDIAERELKIDIRKKSGAKR